MNAVVFAYHNMGLEGLKALKRNGFVIQAVFTHEDDPGENCWFGSVAEWAKKEGISVFFPENVNTDEWIGRIGDLHPDVIFSFYYRNLICQRILDIPRAGAFNLHGSLLPAYRGRVPVNWVLVHGESQTGVTLHHMVKRADAGDMVGQLAVGIELEDTALTLYGKLCGAASVLLDELLPLIAGGRAPRFVQDESQASTFGRRRPEDGKIDWTWPAIRIYNLVRAVTTPYPGAFATQPDGQRITVWWARPADGPVRQGPPGLVVTQGRKVFVLAGEGAVELIDVDISGRRYDNEKIHEYFESNEGIRLT